MFFYEKENKKKLCFLIPGCSRIEENESLMRIFLENKLSNEKLQKSVNNVMMESLTRCRRSVTVKEIGIAPIVAVCIRNFLKENNLMTVKNILVIADPSNITKNKRKF